MAEESVGQLAETIGTPVERLLLHIEEAGLPKRLSEDVILEDEKEALLAFLKKSHGEDEAAPKKITLKRRTLSTLKTGGSAGRGRTVNVEVRKKRTYVRRGVADDASEIADSEVRETPISAEKPVVPDADVERKRQEAAAEKLAEQEERERKAKDEEKLLEAVVAASAESKAEGVPEAAVEEVKTSNRKDKRDRSDLDDEDLPVKKPKQGNRKRRIEELVEDDMLVVDLNDVKAAEEQSLSIVEEKTSDVTPLGLSSPRTRRVKGGKVSKRHKFNVPTEEIKRELNWLTA